MLDAHSSTKLVVPINLGRRSHRFVALFFASVALLVVSCSDSNGSDVGDAGGPDAGDSLSADKKSSSTPKADDTKKPADAPQTTPRDERKKSADKPTTDKPADKPKDGKPTEPGKEAVELPAGFEHRVLPNGLEVYSAHDPSTANVSVQVWYKVGSKDDPAGRSGFAHLFEHLMFKATRNLPPETLDRLTEDVGGSNNAFTADDMTAYYEIVPANHLERILFAEAERMGSLVVDDDAFKSERDVVKEELRQRVLADPYGRLFNLYLPQEAYQEHPYRRPGIGSLENLDAAPINEVLAFHATFYRPDNAYLIVVGNYEESEL
ncbi:MAG TPA: insulinase family protein, partial [Polyangiales bacterium]|nr:insulinase family protein [Polyangiales bacterium]